MKLCKTRESQAPSPSSLQPSLIATCFISRSTLATNHNFTMLFRHQEVAWSRLYISVLWKLLLAELLPLLTRYQKEIFSDLNQPLLKLSQSSSQRFHQRPKCRVTMTTALRWKKKKSKFQSSRIPFSYCFKEFRMYFVLQLALCGKDYIKELPWGLEESYSFIWLSLSPYFFPPVL